MKHEGRRPNPPGRGSTNIAALPLRTGWRRLLLSQLWLTALAVGGFGWFYGGAAAFAAGYGGSLALASAWWLGRGLAAGGRAAEDMSALRRALYVGVVTRFVFVLAAFAAGMGLLQLAAVPMLTAYGACQLGYLLAVRGA